jgi:phospholipid-binding lipoprotein MlaA
VSKTGDIPLAIFSTIERAIRVVPQGPDHGLPDLRQAASDIPASRRFGAAGVIRCVLVLTPVLSLLACAQVPKDPEARAEYEQDNDPAEPTNRKIFAANQFVDHHAMQPVAHGYENYVPGRVRNSLHNFVSNLGQPAVAVNDVLQGNLHRAWTTTQRFAINTTVGGVGLFDVATDWHRPAHEADFGQTLEVWGVGTGPSVQLPLFGPSNVRDSVGKVVGLVTNPASVVPAVGVATGSIGLVDGRADTLGATDSLERTSLDYYATLRSVTAQHRAALVAEGKAGAKPGENTGPSSDTTSSLQSAQAVTGGGAD